MFLAPCSEEASDRDLRPAGDMSSPSLESFARVAARRGEEGESCRRRQRRNARAARGGGNKRGRFWEKEELNRYQPLAKARLKKSARLAQEEREERHVAKVGHVARRGKAGAWRLIALRRE